MTHIVAKIAVMAGLSVTLTGCAQMHSFGDSMWGYTKSAANFVASPVTKLLRSAPEPQYVFDGGAHNAQQAAYNAFLSDSQGKHRSQGLVVPDLQTLPVPNTPRYQTSPYQQAVYQHPIYQAPQTANSIYDSPSYHYNDLPYLEDIQTQLWPDSAPAQIAYAPQQSMPYASSAQIDLAQTDVSDDISFVKVGGGSDMRDWSICEAESGSVFRILDTGYMIEPRFESCMRAKGYKPESEV